MRRSQNLPLSLKIHPLSTTICDTPRIYPSLSEYTPPPFLQLDAIFQESTSQSLNMPPFLEIRVHLFVRQSITPSQYLKIFWEGGVDPGMVA